MSFMPETASTAEVRQTEVESAFSRVDECTSYIDKLTSELEDKLSRSILAQNKSGEAQGNVKNPEPVRVPLAQAMHEHGNHLEAISERLSSIINRLEA